MTNSASTISPVPEPVPGAVSTSPSDPGADASKKPVGQGPGGRLSGIDLARGLAVIGMMFVHLLPVETPEGDPHWSWLVFAGRASALFALLAGVSLSFMSGGRHGVRKGTWGLSAMSIATRAVLIATLGLLLGHMTGELPVILTYYGLLFLVVIPMLPLKPLALTLIGLAAGVLGPIVIFLALPYAPEDSIGAGDPTLGWLTEPGLMLWNLLVTGVYPVLAWASFVIIGLAVGRLIAVRSPRFAARLLLGGLTLAALTWFLSHTLLAAIGGDVGLAERTPGMSPRQAGDITVWGFDESLPTATWWWLAIIAPHTSTPFSVLHALGCAMAVLAVCLLVMRKERRSLAVLVTAGTMPLTMYVGHLILTELVFGDRIGGWVSLLAQFAILGCFAWVWSRRFRQGPLEMALSSATRHVARRFSRPRANIPAAGPAQVSLVKR